MLGTLAISQVIVAVALTLTDHYFLCLWNVKILFFGYLEGDDFASVISKVSWGNWALWKKIEKYILMYSKSKLIEGVRW